MVISLLDDSVASEFKELDKEKLIDSMIQSVLVNKNMEGVNIISKVFWNGPKSLHVLSIAEGIEYGVEERSELVYPESLDNIKTKFELYHLEDGCAALMFSFTVENSDGKND